MSQEKGPDVFFTTMIDLYAIYPSFPRLDEAARLRNSPHARVDFLESAFADDLGDSRFIPYIQLHEFEAYLFSDPSQFSFFFAQCEKQIRALQAIADAHSSPELIDDGAQSAPSKRIIDQIPDYGSAKSVAGPQIAELIGVDVIRSKCPHFNGWLSRLESLGSCSHLDSGRSETAAGVIHLERAAERHKERSHAERGNESFRSPGG